MRFKFKRLASEIFDYSSNEKKTIYYVALAGGAYLLSQRMGLTGGVIVLSVITAWVIFGLMFQVFRKDRNIKSIISNLIASVFGIFGTLMIYLLNVYDKQNNDYMCIKIVQIGFGGIVGIIDILFILFLIDKTNSKEKKVTVTVSMIGITIIAIGSIVALSFLKIPK
ncbi:hypothetical protein [Inconstantimicrobium mannanitabidum]|uniref:Uncharacterized protein n=1 Tax=Inconstantimicrobium mannanitabidum TaxID=1604901 RepID=A0ACB5RHP1_9CLOT|nr:hypothetical protein [Clostridium sp. TW13]GKX68623.1 hypothetical protein rsdtw13_38810 [Clostridium sp. TW13]